MLIAINLLALHKQGFCTTICLNQDSQISNGSSFHFNNTCLLLCSYIPPPGLPSDVLCIKEGGGGRQCFFLVSQLVSFSALGTKELLHIMLVLLTVLGDTGTTLGPIIQSQTININPPPIRHMQQDAHPLEAHSEEQCFLVILMADNCLFLAYLLASQGGVFFLKDIFSYMLIDIMGKSSSNNSTNETTDKHVNNIIFFFEQILQIPANIFSWFSTTV